MKRLLSFILAMLMVLPLVACGKDSDDVAATQTSETSRQVTEEEPQTPERVITLVENGLPLYTVVSVDNDFTQCSLTFRDELKFKTGVTFKVSSSNNDGLAIYVGYDYDELGMGGDEKVSYMGYAIAEKDGNIYICGYTATAVSEAIQHFLDSIDPERHVVMNESKKAVSAVIPASVLTLKNPTYAVQNPTLITSSLAEYRVVIPEQANEALKEITEVFVEGMRIQTGVIIPIVTDAEAPVEHEIIIGESNRPQSSALADNLKPEEFVIKNEGHSVYVAYGSFLAYSGAVSELKLIYAEGEEPTLDVKKSVEDTFGLYRSDDTDFRIMTSNVLFYNIFRNISSKARQQINAETYLTYLPDVIGAQEVCGGNRDVLDEELKDVYGVVGFLDVSGRAYCPIYYRKDRLTLEESSYILATPPSGSTNVFAVARFSFTSDSSKGVIVINLHFSPNSTNDRIGDVQKVNDKLKELQELYPDTPIFVTGDYNCNHDSTEHKTLFDGLQNPMLPAKVVALSGMTNRGIDHIAVTTNLVTVNRFQWLRAPITLYGSDHYPGFIDVSFNETSGENPS